MSLDATVGAIRARPQGLSGASTNSLLTGKFFAFNREMPRQARVGAQNEKDQGQAIETLQF
jgi:hypothetical protein